MSQKDRVREYLQSHPDARPSEVAIALSIPAPSTRRIFQELGQATSRLAAHRVLPPEGFHTLDIENQSTAADTIRARLTETLDNLSYDGRVIVHQNRDGSVDGELTFKVPRGTNERDMFLDIEGQFASTGLSHYVWLSVGERFTIKGDEEVYRRNRGMNEVATYYSRIGRANIAKVMAAGRSVMTSGMRSKYGRKAETIYLRLHWNPDGSKPHRERKLGGK